MKLGDLSARYESCGDPGAIANDEGDAGGKSYGVYQFATNAGVPQAFIQWLASVGYPLADKLAWYKPGSEEFDSLWLQVATADPDGFAEMQRLYVEREYYDVAKSELLEVDYDIEQHTGAICQVVWSAAVQYGPGYVRELFESACAYLAYPNLSYVNSKDFDARMIVEIYSIRASDEWTAGSPSLRPGLRARFRSECDDALAMLGVA